MKNMFPQLFWIALPYHQNFSNAADRFKLNQTLDTVIPLYNEMRVIKIRRRWQYDDTSVSRIGKVTPHGRSMYWSGIDKAIQFWEVGRQKNNFGTFSADHRYNGRRGDVTVLGFKFKKRRINLGGNRFKWINRKDNTHYKN